MTDAAAEASADGQPTAERDALSAEAAARGGTAPLTHPTPAADEHPELVVGAAFAGGLALALLLKRLAR